MPPNDSLFKNIQSLIFGRGQSSSNNNDKIDNPENGYEFLTGLTVDVVSGGGMSFLKNKFNQNKAFIETINPKTVHLLNKIPPNSILVKVIDAGQGLSANITEIAFPFFSPHISMPIKPGEYVWLIKESENGIKNYYWISRKHGIDQIDDVNYTFLERSNTVEDKIEELIKKNIATKKRKSSIENPSNENNEIASLHSYISGQLLDSNFNDDEVGNKKIVNKATDFLERFAYEVTPKYGKNPGDTLIQGSNNAFVHLTTEKFKNELHKNVKVNEPAIDICISRKNKQIESLIEKQELVPEKIVIENDDETSSLSAVKSLTGKNEEKTFELNKTKHLYNDINDSLDYFDQDPLNCGARLYMSKNCSIDDVFNVSLKDFDNKSGSSIATFSENNRILASNSILIVNSYDQDQSSYIAINEAGEILLGSKHADKPSAGSTTGLQPFVRGDDLEKVLSDFMTEVSAALESISKGMQSAVGFMGMPIVSLQAAAPVVSITKQKIDTIKTAELAKIKSSLIKGE